jgi:hypothetical protein
MKIEKYKPEIMLGTSATVGLIEKHPQIEKIIHRYEKQFSKMCKTWNLYMSGMVDVFSDKVKFIKCLEDVRVTLYSYNNLREIFDSKIKALLNVFYKELSVYGQKNKLIIKIHLSIGIV